MDIAGIFREGFEVTRKNYILLIPSVTVMLVMFLLTLLIVGGGMISMGMTGGQMPMPDEMATSAGRLKGGAFLVSLAGGILGLLAHGMTVAMSHEVLSTGSTSFNSGITMVTSRLASLIAAAAAVSIIFLLGAVFFVIPGIVAVFFLMFTFINIMTGNAGAVDAMKGSFQLVKSRIGDAAVLFIALFVAGIAAGIANMVLNFIPLLGQIAATALMGIFSAYISVVMVIAHRKMTG